MVRILSCSALFMAFTFGFTLAAHADAFESVVSVKNVKPNAAAFKDAGRGKPIEIKSADGLAKYFDKDQVAAIGKQVDFKHQVVLIFAWAGSGQDRLKIDVAESDPEQITFHIKRGRTRDLRRHVHVFAVHAVATWSVR